MHAGPDSCLSPPDDACNLNATYPIRGNNLCQLYIGSLMHKCILEINTHKQFTGKKLSETFSGLAARFSECVERCGHGRLGLSEMSFSLLSSSEACGIRIRPAVSCWVKLDANSFSSLSVCTGGGNGAKIGRELEMMANLQFKFVGPQQMRSWCLSQQRSPSISPHSSQLLQSVGHGT